MYYLYFKTKKYVYCTIFTGNILYLYGIFIFMEYKILNFEYWYIKKKMYTFLIANFEHLPGRKSLEYSTVYQ